MTRSAALALSLAGATVAVWFILSIQQSMLGGGDATLAWNVSTTTLLTCYAAFIAAALNAHIPPAGMSRGRRFAVRAGALVLAVAAAALGPQIAVIAAAGYAVFVLAADFRQWWASRPRDLG